MKVHIFTAHLFLTRLRYQRPAALLDQKQGQAQLDCPCAAFRPPVLNGDDPRLSLLAVAPVLAGSIFKR
ncbi:hypothetical protein T11_2432 [Trichinella zimbabwensis]|uniref:Uncharacterized protein n=3 Tax=Trichinella TaxID=6333 RepID=A0A0V1LW72_9BILA|nr:hypothetical protein T11_2432 [Trichinella zimbabwensis]KRZ63700.1 hypothetical protein T10_9656 [Trichinella papuae]